MQLIPPWSWHDRSGWVEENPGVASIYLGVLSAAALSALIALDAGVTAGLGWFVVLAVVIPYVSWTQLRSHRFDPPSHESAEVDSVPAEVPASTTPDPESASWSNRPVEWMSQASSSVLVLCIVAGSGGTIFSVIDAFGSGRGVALFGLPGNIVVVVLSAMALRRRRTRMTTD